MNIYGLILLVALVAPIWIRFNIPLGITYTTQGFYDSIVNVPDDGVIVFGWQTMRLGEYVGKEDSLNAIFSVIFDNNINIICLSLGPVAPLFYEDIFKRNNLDERYGLTYGEDYVITPYLAGEETALAAFAKDTWGSISTDIYGNPIPNLPLMQRVRTLDDVDLTWMSSYSWTNPEQFIRQWCWAYNKPIIYHPGSYWNIAQYYPFPVSGVLDGIKGMAEFEALTGYFGGELARYEASSTFVVVYLIIFGGGFLYYHLVKRELQRPPRIGEEE